MREAFGVRGGTEIDTQGDSFFFSFPRASDAVGAAVDAQRALGAHRWPGGGKVRVRMGLHTGEPQVGEEGYLGIDVDRAARISAAGHGGQILISETTRALLGNALPAGTTVHDLGEARLKDVQHERIYQVSLAGGPSEFPPLMADHPKSAGEALAERIKAQVERQIEQAFTDGAAAQAPIEPARSGMHVPFTAVFALGVCAVLIVLVVKFVI